MPPGAKDATVLAEGGSVYMMAGSANEAAQNSFASFVISVEGQKVGMEGEAAFNVQLPVEQGGRRHPRSARIRAGRCTPTSTVMHGRYSPTIPNWTPVRQATADTINALIADCGLDVPAELTKLDAKLGRRSSSRDRRLVTVKEAAPPPCRPRRRPTRRRRRREAALPGQRPPGAAGWWIPWLFLAPALILFLYFKFIPMAQAILDVGAGGPALSRQHLGRYCELQRDPVVGKLPVGDLEHDPAGGRFRPSARWPLGFALALLVEGQTRKLNFIRSAAFLPVVVPMAVVAELWRIMYHPTSDGLMNQVIALIGLGPSGFIDDPDTSLASIDVHRHLARRAVRHDDLPGRPGRGSTVACTRPRRSTARDQAADPACRRREGRRVNVDAATASAN